MVKKLPSGKASFLKKVDRNMVENVVIFVLLVVIIGLLVKNYMLSSENFTSNGDAKLVLYYAPWCPHCTSFISEWDKIGTEKKINNVLVKVEKVNCEDHPEVATEENIEGFPTVKLHSKNTSSEYNGARNSEAVILWLEKTL